LSRKKLIIIGTLWGLGSGFFVLEYVYGPNHTLIEAILLLPLYIAMRTEELFGFFSSSSWAILVEGPITVIFSTFIGFLIGNIIGNMKSLYYALVILGPLFIIASTLNFILDPCDEPRFADTPEVIASFAVGIILLVIARIIKSKNLKPK